MASRTKSINRIFKFTVLTAILTVSFSIFYYFVIFMPGNESVKSENLKREQSAKQSEAYRQNQEKCSVAGEYAYEKDKEAYDFADFLFEPQYAFNKKLNTCIYSSGYKEGEDWERWVKNSYTNEKVISVMYLSDLAKDPEKKEGILRSVDDYWKNHESLFTN